MRHFKNLDKTEKSFILVFLLGFLIKYNLLMIHIFNVPVLAGLFIRNIVFIIFIIYFIVPLTAKKKGRLWIFFFAIIFTFIFLANFWYNRYFGNYLSVSEMSRGGEDTFNIFGVLFKHIINFTDPLFILDLIIMGLALNHEADKEQQAKPDNSNIPGLKTKIIVLLGLILILIGQMFFTNLALGNPNPTELYAESTPAFVNVYGFVPLYTYESYINLALQPVEKEPEPLPFRPVELDGVEMIDRFSNVIVIQVESLDKKLFNYQHNGSEVIPFLNSLQSESLYGENFYAQHVNGSFDADFSFLTGFYPVNRHYSFRENDMNQFSSLVKILKEQGYETMAFHGNEESFFYRHVAYPELGFDHFYSQEDFSFADRKYIVEDSYLGINDYDFFAQSLEILQEVEEPFFAYFITVTSHTPFDIYPEEFAQDKFTNINSLLVRDYFNSINFVDASLEMFFTELENQGLSDDTLIVLYADHVAGIETPIYTSGVNFMTNRNVKEPEHIPLLIKHPELEPGSIEKTGSVTDLAPTILDILGYERAPRDFLGSSLMQPEERPVLFIHELPQILYQDQLFVNEFNELIKIGHLENEETDITIPDKKEQEALEKIKYSREKMTGTRRDK
ncbi:MAG: LTA synthase family protein [Bacillota bacterium]